MSKNKSIDQMAAQFQSLEELQAYSEAQYKTILSLNSQINDLKKQLEAAAESAKRASVEIAQLKSVVPKEDLGQFTVSDEESICLIQLALLQRHSAGRELIMDEVKRLEILVKTLAVIRGKQVDQKSPAEKSAASSKSEDLFKQLEQLNKAEPQ